MSESKAFFFTLLMPWGRVGSNLLSSSLNTIQGLSIKNEPTTVMLSQGKKAGLSLESIKEQQMEALESFVHSVPSGATATGMKLAYNSFVDPDAYLTALRTYDFRMTLMVRKNFLKCAVSQQRALARADMEASKGQWASPWTVKAHEPKPGAVEIDIKKTLKAAEDFERWHNEMLAKVEAIYGDNYRLIEYEDLAADPEGTARSLLAAWGLPAPEVIAIRHRKATSDQLSHDIQNYEAFEEAVISRGMGHFL